MLYKKKSIPVCTQRTSLDVNGTKYRVQSPQTALDEFGCVKRQKKEKKKSINVPRNAAIKEIKDMFVFKALFATKYQ